MTTAGADSDFAPGNDHVEAIMEHLAVVPAGQGSLRRSVEQLSARSTGGSMVAVVAEAPDEDLRALARLRGRYGSLTIVLVDRSAWDPGAPVGSPPALPVVHVTSATPFATAWDTMLRARRLRTSAHVGSRS